MKGTFATLALAGAAAAAPYAGHAQFHEKKDIASDMVNSVMADVNSLMSDAVNVLTKMGSLKAINSMAPTADSWVGKATTGNAVVNTIVNNAKKDAYFTCWGADASWVNAHAPTVAVMVPAGKNVTISHAIAQNGATNTGGCAPVFDDTKMVNGQISQSWLEFNWLSSQWGSSTFDLSMEVNPQGHNMSIVADKCTSDMNRCSFHCNDASKACGEPGTYTLKNCEAGSQEAASAGQWGGQASGGCQGIANTGITTIKTILH